MSASSPRRSASALPKEKSRSGGGFSPLLKIGAALRKGSTDPRAVKLARLGVSGQGAEGVATPIPPLDDPHLRSLEIAPIRDTFSYVRITYHDVRNEHMYEVIEPPMTEIEKALRARLHDVLVDAFEPLPEFDPDTKRTE